MEDAVRDMTARSETTLKTICFGAHLLWRLRCEHPIDRGSSPEDWRFPTDGRQLLASVIILTNSSPTVGSNTKLCLCTLPQAPGTAPSSTNLHSQMTGPNTPRF
ncbi:hypothetical protein SCP_0412480 [Sparassis crispa]|uniref:Uncharacterized protein n=1 Tax=Sparassis crispa TaxID=139825 RepID=A0A401GL12_9APHY|nr:hypothetical protein SCP_0412480 [Sparassis crispa]GBE82861.1 hypothetical protein SCP_0412480 [Sparassis crispa]